MEQQTFVQKHTLIGLSVLVMVMFGIYAFAITFYHPVADPTIMGMILGILGTGGFGVVMSYFFGSSTGSASKSEVINKLTEEKK